MRSTLAFLQLIADVLRRRNYWPNEKEYLGYESYPSSQISPIKAPLNFSSANVKHRKAA